MACFMKLDKSDETIISLHAAIRKGDMDETELLRLLHNNPASAKEKDPNGFFPLATACES